MKNGLLVCAGEGKKKNIGDYIQSVAAESYFEKVDVFIERERLDKVESSGGKIRLIMNGWFMHHPENWPPSDDIEPLFVSFHVTPKNAPGILSDSGVAYLKRYEPIGCRDTNTVKLLEAKGVSSYFSGCLTLTLGQRYPRGLQDGSVYFVDPYFENFYKINGCLSWRAFWMAIPRIILNIRTIMEISKKIPKPYLKAILSAASFYVAYSAVFEDSLLADSKFVYHSIEQARYPTHEDKLALARSLLAMYSTASLVVTSRIHCALPCLGLGTPVYFVTSDNLESENPIRSKGRLGGNKELLRVLRYSKGNVTIEDLELAARGGKISTSEILQNKSTWLPLKGKLEKVCKDFAASTAGE